MSGKALGRAAADLPWLRPNAESLIALAERPSDAAAGAPLADAAYLAFLLRFARAEAADGPVRLSAERLQSPALPETALAYLTAGRDGWLDRSHPLVAELHEFAKSASSLASSLAARSDGVDPAEAAAAARLAALGWFAVASLDPGAAAAARGPSADSAAPSEVQVSLWGLDQDAIARRLALRWRLPERLAGIVGHLNLPFRVARHAADPDLFAVVQLAVAEAERRYGGFGLTRGADPSDLLFHLRLDAKDAAALEPPRGDTAPEAPPADPHGVPLLPNLLRMAAESRRRNGASLVVRLEGRNDRLQGALSTLARTAADRVREARLQGLAELAAGAGHEINNPLAVIAGHAQLLRQKETDPEREKVLRTIERQTERIASLVKGLMQFARPSRPQRQRWRAADLLAGLADELTREAEERGVRFEAMPPPPEAWVEADREQVRQAVRAVASNAIEAAPRGGWVRLGIDAECGRDVALFVEDSGPGVAPGQRESLFDPFYCGRPAGRGRGLGLSIAWRTATANGGDLRYEPLPDGTTRFVLTLPRAADAMPERRSA